MQCNFLSSHAPSASELIFEPELLSSLEWPNPEAVGLEPCFVVAGCAGCRTVRLTVLRYDGRKISHVLHFVFFLFLLHWAALPKTFSSRAELNPCRCGGEHGDKDIKGVSATARHGRRDDGPLNRWQIANVPTSAFAGTTTTIFTSLPLLSSWFCSLGSQMDRLGGGGCCSFFGSGSFLFVSALAEAFGWAFASFDGVLACVFACALACVLACALACVLACAVADDLAAALAVALEVALAAAFAPALAAAGALARKGGLITLGGFVSASDPPARARRQSTPTTDLPNHGGTLGTLQESPRPRPGSPRSAIDLAW